MTLRLNGSASGYVEIDAPATAGSNTLVLPTGNGTNGQVLSTNGSGALSWVQGGRILQVVQAGPFNGVTTTSGSAQFSTTFASITPSSTSSQIIQLWSTSVQIDVDNDSNGSNNGFVRFDYQIGGTGGTWVQQDLFYVPGRGGNGAFTHASFLSSFNTTSTVYFRIGIGKNEGARNIILNDTWGSNTVILMEVAA